MQLTIAKPQLLKRLPSRAGALPLRRFCTALKTAESFLKAVLRHYKVDVKSANVQPLLGGRAKLYFRVGRLLQSWPQHQVTVYVGGLPQC